MPDELDPQVREFASQLRRLVDRSGLSIAAVADRTGYSKTSWERYLNGRLLAPKGAIVALAEVTGTNPVHLTTMWELAERAWSRSEMRHDMTMQAIQISQARAALGEFGPTPAKGGRNGKQAGAGGSAKAAPKPGVAGPAGVAPTVPPQSPAPGEERRPYGSGTPGGASSGAGAGAGNGSGAGPGAGRGAGSRAGGGGGWGAVATPSGPSAASGGSGLSGVSGAAGVGPGTGAGAGASGYSGASGSGGSSGSGPAGSFGPSGLSGSAGGPPQDARPPQHGGSPDGQLRKRRFTMFLAGVVGALVVIAAAVFLTSSGGDSQAETPPKTPATSADANTDLPEGVECAGADCVGKDAETMGCSGDLANTATSVTVGTTLVEVRYSKTCGAAWARITQAAQGDEVEVSVGGGKAKQTGSVSTAGDTTAYTPMVAVKDAGEATACATLKSGQEGCTQ
ncbi:XRE family transcriptional regulator [Streptomyces sp. NPDC050704]|uniref:XRE family transcriptional regulator n=1 Tax=Streptomyces sp. NPDC050704 TaxID=3157219 RepID=UPI00342C0B6C